MAFHIIVIPPRLAATQGNCYPRPQLVKDFCNKIGTKCECHRVLLTAATRLPRRQGHQRVIKQLPPHREDGSSISRRTAGKVGAVIVGKSG
jgi:hypothetical protein